MPTDASGSGLLLDSIVDRLLAALSDDELFDDTMVRSLQELHESGRLTPAALAAVLRGGVNVQSHGA